MRDCERELLEIIRESKDPAKAIIIDTDILSRCVAGESMESIAASYGLKLEELQKLSDEALDIYKRERVRK